METPEPHTFSVGRPYPPSIKAKIGQGAVYLMFSIIALTAAMDKMEVGNKYYQLLVWSHPFLFWGILLIILLGALAYTIYEQSKHKTLLTVDSEKITITHNYNGSPIDRHEIAKSAINKIALEAKDLGNRHRSDRRLYLSIDVRNGEEQTLDIPWETARALTDRLTKCGYSIPSPIEQLLEYEKKVQKSDKFFLRWTIFALTFIVLWGIFIGILFYFVSRK